MAAAAVAGGQGIETAIGAGQTLLTASQGVAGWLTRRARPVLQYACVGCAAVVFAPLCWSSYLPLLLVLPAIGVRILRERIAARSARTAPAAGAATAFVTG